MAHRCHDRVAPVVRPQTRGGRIPAPLYYVFHRPVVRPQTRGGCIRAGVRADGGYGSFGGGGNRPIHVHVEMNGTQVASALIPSLTGANGRYAVRNSGKATGVWKPV